MTPHDLINLPGAGNAEKWLRDNSMWHITMTDTERIEWIANCADTVKRGRVHGFWIIDTETDEEFDPEHLRDAIDTSARSDAATGPL